MTTRARTRIATIALTSALFPALAACNSSGGGSESPSTSSKFTGSPVSVMTVAPTGGGLDYGYLIDVAKGAVKKINDDGGLNGHEVKLLTCNLGLDPNLAGACARKAVQEKVIALVGGLSANADSMYKVLEPALIPWIASGSDSADLSNKVSYPLTPGGLSYAALGARAAADGCKSTAVLRYDVPLAAGVVQLVGQGLASKDKKVDADIKVPTTTTDFSSLAKQASESDCQVVALPPDQTVALAAAGKSLGLKNRFYAPLGVLSDSILAKAAGAFDGAVTQASFPTKDDPVWKDAKAAVKNVDWSLNQVQNTWAGFQVLRGMSSKLTELNSKSVVAALDKGTAIDTGGLTDPIDFSKGLSQPGLTRVFNTKIVYLTVEDGKLTQDGDFVDIGKTLGG